MSTLRRVQGEGPPDAPREEPRFDPVLLAAVVALVAVGCVMVYSASAVEAGRRLGDEFHYLKRQAFAAAIGFAALFAALRVGYRKVLALAYPGLLASLLLLVAVMLFGKTAGGAQRWIPLGPLNLQPSEIAKIALVLYLARSLARKGDHVRTFSIGLLPHLIVTCAMVGLCLWQRDLGTGVILFLVMFAMLFTAGARVSYLLAAAIVAAPIAWHIVKSTPYRYARWLAFLDPEQYKTGVGFQLWESLLGTANGGWLGQGLGQGKGKLFFLPAAHTDFIAAVIAEETGLLGILFLLALHAVVVWRGIRAALRASDALGCYAAVGLTVLVGAQTAVNLMVVFGLLPTKGLTLPFISYGGSSLITLLAGCGVLLSISGERGGFLRRLPAAIRIGAPVGGAPRLAPVRGGEAP
ncbi:putative lipid II flippase FtsW [Anaeromyxobacter oryzisoli]|uniref:putative lipid II flippase FtsW n=1 Tax=Anaeromyxobacter oryzisoli TaxID=2925408 RepID=UPI001F584ED5|nr:putative lipid II flippase FtsW [Anaeromyxobacter sp. SG63]